MMKYARCRRVNCNLRSSASRQDAELQALGTSLQTQPGSLQTRPELLSGTSQVGNLSKKRSSSFAEGIKLLANGVSNHTLVIARLRSLGSSPFFTSINSLFIMSSLCHCGAVSYLCTFVELLSLSLGLVRLRRFLRWHFWKFRNVGLLCCLIGSGVFPLRLC